MKMKFLYIAILISGTAFLSSCGAGGENTGWEYAPNMYHSFAYEPMSQEEDRPNGINPHGMNMREPVKGTIARGQMDFASYSMPVSNESYEASASLKNPLPATESHLKAGERAYKINCTPCHGDDGKGDGTIVKDGKFPPPPSYDSERIRATPEGKMYYSIRYGKNLMGPYGTVLSPTQIWQVVHYIKTLRGSTEAASPKADSTTASAK